LASGHGNITELKVDFTFAETINPIYKPAVDSAFENALSNFNLGKHVYTVRRVQPDETADLVFHLKRGRFVSKGWVTTGYIINGLGLVTTPAVALITSSGTGVGLFFYFPLDEFEMEGILSPELNAKPVKRVRYYADGNALFVNKKRRYSKMMHRFGSLVHIMLDDVNRQILKSR
jgi:hypothetical protein